MEPTPSRQLSVAVLQTRDAEISGFEDFYLLTWQNTYADIKASVQDEETAWNILRDVYAEVWKRKENMPEAGIIRPWIRVLIKDVTKQIPGRAIEDFPSGTEKTLPTGRLLDDRALSVLISTEERLGILNEAEIRAEDRRRRKLEKQERNIPAAVIRILASAAVTVMAAAAIFNVSRAVGKSRMQITRAETEMFASSALKQQKTVAGNEETEAVQYGWNKSATGKRYRKTDGTFAEEEWLEDGGVLYYFDRSSFMVTGQVQIDGQQCVFGSSGALTSISRKSTPETKDTILTAQMKIFARESELTAVVADSVTVDGDWIYFLKKDFQSVTPPALMRFSKNSGLEEMVVDQAEGYILTEQDVWYSRDGAVLRFRKADAGTAVGSSGFILSENGGKFYLKDIYGKTVTGTGGFETIGDRTYRVQDGLIKYVKPAVRSIGSKTFLLSAANAGNRIFLSDGSIYLEQGQAIDCFTTVGNRLYYSALMEMDGNQPESQIWQINVDTGQRAEVTGLFPGRMQNMYYYSDQASVYMEYTPGEAGSISGGIAVLNAGGQLYRLNSSQGSDEVAELIWVESGKVSCYLHRCSEKRNSDGTLKVLSTSVMNLSDADRTPVAAGAAGAGTETGTSAAKPTEAGRAESSAAETPAPAEAAKPAVTAAETDSPTAAPENQPAETAAPTEDSGPGSGHVATVSPVPAH